MKHIALMLIAAAMSMACADPDDGEVTSTADSAEFKLLGYLDPGSECSYTWQCEDIPTRTEYWLARHTASSLCMEYTIGDRYACVADRCTKTATGAVIAATKTSLSWDHRDKCDWVKREPRPSTEVPVAATTRK